MLKRVPLSLPHLVTVLLNIHFRAPFLEVEANIAGLTCSSPCEQSDASGTSGIALPPCTVSTTNRIHLTTGYEVKVKCQHSICAEMYFCVSILFDRTLTDDNVDSNFSVTCQSGDFAQPGMDYTTIIRSLPNSNDNSNEQRFLTTMPSCEPKSNLTACKHQDPKTWRPLYWPKIFHQFPNGSVEVLFMTDPDYTKYDVILSRVGGGSSIQYPKTYVNIPGGGFPSVLFDDVESGIYRAYIRIHEDLCDGCPMIRSDETFTVTERPEAWRPKYRPRISQLANGSVEVLFLTSPDYAKYDVSLSTVEGSYNTYCKTYVNSPGDVFPSLLFDDVKSGIYRAYLRIHEDLCDDCIRIRSASTFNVTAMPPLAPSASLAMLSGSPVRILLVVLVIFVVVCTCRRSPVPPSKSSSPEIEIGSELAKSAFPSCGLLERPHSGSIAGRPQTAVPQTRDAASQQVQRINSFMSPDDWDLTPPRGGGVGRRDSDELSLSTLSNASSSTWDLR